MAEIVNTDKLNLILTNYGLGRVREALENPTVKINITKIKLGSGENYNYYVPSEGQTGLKGDLGLEFDVLDKELLEDELTICFHSVITENTGGIDIREVGLYETVDGQDFLFAISTQQPLVKPSINYNYLISVDYYMFLKMTNWAELYDRIILSPDNRIVTEPDLEELMKAFTFSYGNMMVQIGNNSRIIGYNRATQLNEIINANKTEFSYLTVYSNYSSLLDYIDTANILGYWVFAPSRHNDLKNSIPDISPRLNNISTNNEISSYEQSTEGFSPMFTFNEPNYFYLNSDISLDLLNETQTWDSAFTMMFALEPLTPDVKRTLIAKSNYSSGFNIFEVNETAERALEVKLFTDSANYLTFTTMDGAIPASKHSIVLTYNNIDKEMVAYISGNKCVLTKTETGTYTHMSNPLTTLYGFSCSPQYIIYSDTAVNPTKLYNADGTTYQQTSSGWHINENLVQYGDITATYTSSENIEIPKLYAWTYEDAVLNQHTIYTKENFISENTVLYYSNYEEKAASDTSFKIVPSGPDFVIQYQGNNTAYRAENDIPAKTVYAQVAVGDPRIIYANSNINPGVLYNADGTEYTGTLWTISGGVVKYTTFPATYDSDLNIQTSILNMTSYIINNNGERAQLIDSKVSLVSIIKEILSDSEARTMSLLLESTLGNNPYIYRS